MNLQMQIPPQKLEELYQTHKNSLFRYSRNITKSDDLSHEIVQDVFLKLLNQDWPKIQSYINQWLFTVCRNNSLKLLNKETRYISFLEGELERKPCEEKNPNEKAISKEECKKAVELLEKLGPTQKKIMKMRFLKQFSNLEISKKLKMKNNTVAFHVSDGCKKLRQLMAKI